MKELSIKDIGKIYDDKGNEITFTQEQIDNYLQLEKKLKSDLVEVAKTLVEIKNKQFFLMRGYASFKEYVNDALAYSYGTVQRYIAVEQNFGGLIDYSKYSITKLAELTKNEDAITRLQKAKSDKAKDKVIKEELDKMAKTPDKKPEEKKQLLLSEVMRNYREDIQLFTTHVDTGVFIEDDEAILELAKIYQHLEKFWSEIEPAVMSRMEEVVFKQKKQEEITKTDLKTAMSKLAEEMEKEDFNEQIIVDNTQFILANLEKSPLSEKAEEIKKLLLNEDGAETSYIVELLREFLQELE